MLHDAAFLLTDPDYFRPIEYSDPGPRFAPAAPPAGWTRSESGVWTHWLPPEVALPDQGWKVHVSSALENTHLVLDIVAGVCAELGVPFKHLTGRAFFGWLHSKHGSRVQSGKFCALYPPTPQRAHEVLIRLERALYGIAGPYVLTDRRFGESQCVSYRFGAFRPRYRLQADGSKLPTMRALDGTEIPDERRPEFFLPAGVVDPFGPPPEPADTAGEVSFHGYTFEEVLQHSNAGGAYRVRDSHGGACFVKEARGHNGYVGARDARQRLEHEYLTLRALHAAAPGLAPRPIELFTEWENTYLVTEFVPGRTLTSWMVATTPLIHAGADPASFAGYYRRCRHILEQLTEQIQTLHRLGYAFVDISPGNVLVADDDTVRLIDVEAVQRLDHPLGLLSTPGFTPPELRTAAARAEADPRYVDAYALAALAQTLIFPMHEAAERSPQSLAHLHADLADVAAPPAPLWDAALRYRRDSGEQRLPDPETVRADPITALAWLRDRTADALERMAEPGHPISVYPLGPKGYGTNTRGVAHGTAGVLHALRSAGRTIDPAVRTRLRDESLAARDDTCPGLMFGNAGIALVLDDLGEREAAATLLAAAGAHRLATESATWGGGAAGIAMAYLLFHRRTGDPGHLEQAHRLLSALPADLRPLLGADNAGGLLHGRPGPALALYYLATLTGEQRSFDHGLRLLHEELAHAELRPGDALEFRTSERDLRVMPYLASGSAGYALVASRYLRRHDDPVLAEALRRCLRSAGIRFTAAPGLFHGQAGMALAQADSGLPLDPARWTALFKYAIPGATGVRWLGGHGQRLSADLATGSAGVLLALHHALTGSPDPLFTLDAAAAPAAPQPVEL
ncbi:class III lanthionine synthetase LanKC [Nocardia sp. NPDC048505]|uniref:class III lanthionine synthetase LanKC n=1 Tax=unclassified Nocardia TaxID=2637762 RepID=UPI00340137C1